MTVIVVCAARSYSPAMFEDLTDVPHVRVFDKPSGVTTLTFDGDLSAEVADAIWARMESKNDADQAKRADLRAARDAVTGDDPISVAVRAAIDYQLGD